MSDESDAPYLVALVTRIVTERAARIVRLSGTTVGTRLGVSLSTGVDVDLDGVGDLVVGADMKARASGIVPTHASPYARCFSGSDQAIICTVSGPGMFERGKEFGRSVALVDRLGRGSVPMIAIGGPSESPPDGVADCLVLLTKRTGEWVARLRLDPAENDGFGWSMHATQGLLAVGAPYAIDKDGERSGKAVVYTIPQWDTPREYLPEPGMLGFGCFVRLVGDVDHGGDPDLAIGTLSQTGSYLTVYSSERGRSVFSRRLSADHQWEWAADPCADYDGDGIREIVVGISIGLNDAGEKTGKVILLSGRTGALLKQMVGPKVGARFGCSVREYADLNGDGYEELIVGSPGASRTGAMFMIDMAAGTVLRTVLAEEPDSWFGYSLETLADRDGDGYPEILVGQPERQESHVDRRLVWGSVSILSSRQILAAH